MSRRISDSEYKSPAFTQVIVFLSLIQLHLMSSKAFSLCVLTTAILSRGVAASPAPGSSPLRGWSCGTGRESCRMYIMSRYDTSKLTLRGVTPCSASNFTGICLFPSIVSDACVDLTGGMAVLNKDSCWFCVYFLHVSFIWFPRYIYKPNLWWLHLKTKVNLDQSIAWVTHGQVSHAFWMEYPIYKQKKRSDSVTIGIT